MKRHIGKTYMEAGGCFGLLETVLNDKYGRGVLGLTLEPVDKPETGDILEFGKKPRHCGIVMEEGKVLHADVQRGVVVDDIKGIWNTATILRVSDE